jgi:predicted nucleic acid-binding protein
VNVFLDSSVLLAACGSAAGASRAVIDSAAAQSWSLLTSGYVLAEIEANLATLPSGASDNWAQLRAKLETVPDVLTFEWPTVFAPARDRPILFTAAAWAEVLLTLDRRDFADLLGTSFYGLAILKPGDFLQRERAAGRLAGRVDSN